MLTVFLTFHAIIYSNDIVNRFSSCNGILIIGLNGIDELAFVKCYGVVVVSVRIHCVGYSYVSVAIICYSSNGVGILSIFLNKALQSIFINTNYIILIIQIATAYAVIYSNDSMTGFCSSNSIGIICLNSFNELIFINSYGIIVVTVCINSFSNIYITVAVSLCGSNSVIIMLLNKIAQLFAINAKLICMVAAFTIIFNRQDIGIYSNGSNSISSGNTLHLLVYPALRSNTVYAAGVNFAGIIVILEVSVPSAKVNLLAVILVSVSTMAAASTSSLALTNS